ncbi:MAG TPA: translocation/assembly module TamB domain-containing protein, partial [Cyclobacteriaceae bacterium]
MNLQGIKNRIRKILAYTLTAILFLIVSSFLVLQMPPVQNYLIGKYLKSLTDITGFKSSIKSFRMLWFDRLEINDLNIYDPDSNKMIGAKEILINFKLAQLFNENNVDIDGLYVEGAQVLLTDVNASDTSRYLNINVFIDRIAEAYASADTTSTGKSTRINIGEATVKKSSFIYIDAAEDSIREGFDYYHFALDVDEGDLESFSILGDTTEFNVTSLQVKDRATQFGVEQLTTFFRICQTSMEFTNLDLHAGKSVVKDTVIFSYKDMGDMGDFFNKVNIKAKLKDCLVEPKDLAVFAPGVEPLRQVVTLNGEINGRVNKFKYSNMDFKIGNTSLYGSLEMDGLPDLDETFINLNLKNSTLAFPDIAFLLNDITNDQLKPLGKVGLHGQFIGYPNDFVANGDITSKLGRIKSDINLKIKEGNFDESVYSGRLALKDFKLGEYLNDTAMYQTLNMDGSIKGSGLKSSNADFILNGKVSSIGINGYNYTNITTNARFASEFFNGAFSINDPNLEFKAKGSIDLRQQRNIVKIQASLDTAFLNNLNLTSKKIFLQSNVDINIKGLELDSIIGTANLKDFTIRYDEEELKLKDVSVVSERDGKNRAIALNTTYVDAEVKGDFLFTDITKNINTLIHEIGLNIKNDKRAIVDYYLLKGTSPKNYEADFNIKLKKIDAIANLIDIDFGLSPNITIKGNFVSGHTTKFQAFATVDSLHYNGMDFMANDIELTASKISDSTSVLAMAYVNSNKQFYGPNFQTENLIFEGIWNKSHIDFGLDADQEVQQNSMRLKGTIDFMKDSTQIRFLPSAFDILKRKWTFNPNNIITTANHNWHFSNVELQDAGQALGLSGNISDDPAQKLFLNITKLDLSILNVITGLKFKGLLDAHASVNDVYQNPYVQNEIFVDSLQINDFLVGDITGNNLWDNAERKFDINFFIDRFQSRIVNLTGYYNPSLDKNPLNINAKLENANLKIIEPFLEGIFSKWGGTISGNYLIHGTFSEPDIDGEGTITNGEVMIDYLKTQYKFIGSVGLTKNSLDLKHFELTDGLKNKAKLHGSITHTNFNDPRINLTATFHDFQVLNTSLHDNDLFYGQAYASGQVNFSGPFSNLKITATAKSEKNTRIFIPLEGTSSVVKKDFINFVNFSDSTFLKSVQKQTRKKLDLGGLTFDLNLDITPDAYGEIIIDVKAGDIIRGRGNGDLQLQLDTRGEFNMFGQFEFTTGAYNFTLYDIINKEFEIQRGSSITWYGDPYAGNLNVNAIYNQLASFGPILSDQTKANLPQLRRKYPAQVVLKLDGPMLSPNINFDITAKDLPQSIPVDSGPPIRLGFEFNAFKSKLDEQELKRQVFSLI